MLRALEAFGIHLVNVLRAGGTGGEPAVLGDDLESANGSVVLGRAGELGDDLVARELLLLDHVGL